MHNNFTNISHGEHKMSQICSSEGLISISEALRAMACGRLVQCTKKDLPNWKDLEITKINAKDFVDEERIHKNGFIYRFKPSQISGTAQLTQMKKPQ